MTARLADTVASTGAIDDEWADGIRMVLERLGVRSSTAD
jgi:hypothetical protein